MPLVLVVDDATALADQYAYDLRRVGGFETLVAVSGEEALEVMQSEAVDCVLLDLEMPGIDGFEVLRRLRRDKDHTPVIVYTGTGNYDRCTEAIRLGARSFIDKSESMGKVVQEVENALNFARLEQENRSLKRSLAAESPLLGESQPMVSMYEQIRKLASIPSPVLITGESGTGKELVARELHRLRFDDGTKRLVALNCAALPEQLVESELFGHERGAFTGADRAHSGAFQQAAGGTLFLDEIGELPLPAQAKLLRVLENGEITRLGGEKTLKVDARIVCATNRDLDSETKAGTFREDLLYRLNVHVIRVPSLRERTSDIPQLAQHFVERISHQFGMRPMHITPQALEALAAYSWSRNNVRELRNVIERMIIAADGDALGLEDVPPEIADEGDSRESESGVSFKDQKIEAERRIVVSALVRNDWHISRTAESLGLSDHASLLKIMRRHNLKRSS